MRSPFDAAASLAATMRQPDVGAVFPSVPRGARRELRDPKAREQVRAFRNAVFKAVRWRYNQIAKLDRSVVLVTFERDDAGRLKEVRTPQGSHPVTRIFAKGARGQPNPFVTSGNFLSSIEVDLGLTGNHYSLKVRETEGSIAGAVRWLLRIRPDWVKVIPDEKNIGIDGYAVRPPGFGKPFNLMASEVMHVKTPSPEDDRIGWSPLRSLNYSVDTGDEIRRFNWQFFEQGARLDGVVEGAVGANAVEEVYDMLVEGHHRGADTAWLPLVLPQGLKFTPTQATAKDFEFAALAGFSESDVLEGYGVPKGLLGTVDDVSLANLRGLMTIGVENAIKPELRTFGEHIEFSLLNRDEYPNQADDAYFAFEFEDPTPGDPDQERKDLESDLKAGVRTINEERAERGDVPVGWGDRPWFPGTMVQVGEGEDETGVTDGDDEVDA
jgi:HK97 family phage portal protein